MGHSLQLPSKAFLNRRSRAGAHRVWAQSSQRIGCRWCWGLRGQRARVAKSKKSNAVPVVKRANKHTLFMGSSSSLMHAPTPSYHQAALPVCLRDATWAALACVGHGQHARPRVLQLSSDLVLELAALHQAAAAACVDRTPVGALGPCGATTASHAGGSRLPCAA